VTNINFKRGSLKISKFNSYDKKTPSRIKA
jgi:hypothetical protein